MRKSNSEFYKNYYVQQAQQKGGNLPAFHGGAVQHGYGLGSILKGLYRWAVPHLTTGVKSVGRQAIKEGLGVAQDVMDGQSLKESTLKSVKQTGKKLMNSQNVSGAQTGGGRKGRKRKTQAKKISSSPAKKQRTSKAKQSPFNNFF